MRVSDLDGTLSVRIYRWVFILCQWLVWAPFLVEAQTIEPPKIAHLEPVVIPSHHSIPESGLIVRVLIRTDGTARLDDPDLEEGWKPYVEQALLKCRFEAANKEGVKVASRIMVHLPVAELDSVEPTQDTTFSNLLIQEDDTPAGDKEKLVEDELAFGATAHIQPRVLESRRLETQELRDLPGAFGDPFRSLESLPSVAPYTSFLPYVYVRGAPPAGTLFIYDDIPLPILFHLGVGPAVIHPAMIGPIEFYSGVGPARYGRRTGGLFKSAWRENELELDSTHGELEFRLIDFIGMLRFPIHHGSLTVAGRYGYPGLLVSLISPEIELDYWDYQLRLAQPLDGRTQLEIVWFGSYDELSTVQGTDGVMLTFHRLELRLVRSQDRWQYGTALLFGYEESRSDAGTYQDSEAGEIWAGRVGPRVWFDYRDKYKTHLRFGADMIGIIGRIERDEPISTVGGRSITPKQTSYIPSYVRSIDRVDFNQFNNPLYTWVASRNTAGIYTEVGFQPAEKWMIELGLRGDLWITGHRSQLGVDPRILVTHHILNNLDIHLAVGLIHQPAVFLLPLPGIADVALDRGLQEAIQSEAGVGLDLSEEARLEIQTFVHYYTDLLFPELAIEKLNRCLEGQTGFNSPDVPPNICTTGQGFPRATSTAYGGEVFLRRPIEKDLSGWLSYTLTWAQAESENGFSFTPVFDMRHIGNLVLQYQLLLGWRVGMKLHARSGKMFAILTDDFNRLERRLPGFYRIDVHSSYSWQVSWGRMQVSAEWYNLTLSREAQSMNCGLDITDQHRLAPDSTCHVQYGPALFFPNVGLRAEF